MNHRKLTSWPALLVWRALKNQNSSSIYTLPQNKSLTIALWYRIRTQMQLCTVLFNPVPPVSYLANYCLLLPNNFKPSTILLVILPKFMRSHQGNSSLSPFILNTDQNTTKIKTYFPCLVTAVLVSNDPIKQQRYNLHGMK